MYFVYIIKNHQGLFYKGYTQNLERRLLEHNTNVSRYASGKGSWLLLYFGGFETKTAALKGDLRLKKNSILLQ
ncbi:MULTISPECIES: GIY-YIG nuclease family protein [unclassified Flavobacterium]|uniref:GIY-YIG nuclease family protein n=1 Tax=unclassified Flavobacterium TaxID=196869 RepID=UPI00131A8519